MAAAYATSGSGKYKNEILWLTWGGGVNGTAGRSIKSGDKTEARIQVTTTDELHVTCTISDISSANGLKSYRPGDWTGDKLDEAYNIGGSNTANQLIAGIVADRGPDNFKITCDSMLVSAGGAQKGLNLRGYVIADAESMAPGEYILGAARGTWAVVEHLGVDKTPYFVDKTVPATAAQKIGAANDSYIKLVTKAGDGQRGVVTFLNFAQQQPTQSMAFQIKGNGKTAIAIGLLVPFADFGDAPASYGSAMHMIADVNFSSDGIGATGEVNAMGLAPSVLNPPRVLYLGSTGPDSESESRASDDALGDDRSGQSGQMGSGFYGREEDAWPTAKQITVLDAGKPLDVRLTCSPGTLATVAGWIDFDQNGKFDAGERGTGSCSGGTGVLSWPSIPLTAKSGKTFARLRIASNPAQIATPDGVADDGEVEDHQIEILGPQLSIQKSVSPTTAWTEGMTTGSYTLRVSNVGGVETGTQAATPAGSLWKRVVVTDKFPDGVEPVQPINVPNWSCGYVSAPRLMTCTLDRAVSIASGASMNLDFPVTVGSNIRKSDVLTNYASVAGSLDPFNGGNPVTDPSACRDSDGLHCAYARVKVEQPAVVVTKTANPPSGTAVDVGNTVTYTLQVTVSGPLTNGALVLNDFLGAGLEYVTPLPQQTHWTVGTVPSNSLDPLTISLAPETGMGGVSAAAPRPYIYRYSVRVLATAGSKVGNQVRVTTAPVGGTTFDPNISCTSCSTEHVLDTPEVRTSKVANPTAGTVLKAGEVVEYTLTAVVTKAKTRDAVVLTDMLGAGLEFGAMTANAGGFVLGGSGATHTFTLPAGKAPGTYTVKYSAVVKADATATGLLNRVEPTWQTTPGNNNLPNIGNLDCVVGSCETQHTMSGTDVVVSKSTTAQKARIGDEVDYEVVVTVKDAATTAPVTLTDTLGAGLAFVSGSASGALTVSPLNATQLQLQLPAGTVPGTYRVKYRATVTAAAATLTVVANGVTITSGGGDTTPACTTCTTSTPLVQSTIKYSKTVNSTGPAKVGDDLVYTVKVEIRDAATREDIVVEDNLGAGLVFKNSISTGMLQVSHSSPASKLTATLPKGTAPGDYLLVYTVTVQESAQGMLTNTVSMDYNPPGGANPPSCANSCATQTPLADPVIKISKQANTAGPVTVSAVSPATIRYTVTVKVENAALPAAQSQLVDNLGAGLILVSGSVVVPGAPAWPAMSAGNKMLVVVIPAGTVPGVYTITYDATVTVDAIGQVENHVNGAPATGGVTPVCDGPCIVTIPVLRAIDAVDDDYTANPVKGSVGNSYLGNAYRNDTLNGQPVTLQTITGNVDKVELCTSVTTSPVTGCRSVSTLVPQMDAATGSISVPPGTPMGDYLISYTICDQMDATLCDSAVVKVRVVASIAAKNDGVFEVERGSGSELTVGNALDNDTIDGISFTPDKVNVTAPPYDSAGKVPGLDPNTGNILVPPATPAGEYQIPYTICDKLNPSNCATATITVVVKGDASLLRVVKTAAVRVAKVGDLVRYTLTVENVGTTNVSHASLVDTPAAGMTYVAGSLQTLGLGSNVSAQGVRPVAFNGVSLAAGQTGAISYLARVGAGIQQGTLVNKALVRNGAGDTISNVATASVQVSDDSLLDHSLIFGTVFDDRDGDGWQDSAAVTGLKVQGGFAPSTYVAGSTTMDRGDGPQAVADASAPLLHGVTVGDIAARESEADPVRKHQVVIRQKLSSLDFTDDFVLTSEQGVSVRMNAQGQTRMEQQGEAAAGRNAVQLDVQRHVTPTKGGYWVDYVLRSTGVDERGIPGVRIASVEGVLIETDQFGRFHLVDVHGGAWERGRNFVLKLDPSTLPEGASLTTSNPLLRRITPGLPVRFDFGVKLQPAHLVGGMQWVELELGSVLFAPGQAQLQTQYLPVITKVADKLVHYRGGELLVQADGEDQALALARAQVVYQAVVRHLPPEVAQQTRVSVHTLVDQQGGIVSGVTAQGLVLGTVLFDTDKAVVRPAYRALLAEVARMLNQQGGGVLHITGHTDVRASYIYNQKLGMQRAHAVYEALLPHLSDAVKARVRVEPPIGAERDVTRRQAKPVPGVPEVNPVPSN